MVILLRVVNSPFGKTLQALRENKDRALSIGYNIDRFKLVTFIISGFFSGLAGGLYALLLNFVPLSSLYWTTSGDVVVMTVVGGMGTLFGPVIGAAGTILLRDILSNFTESWNTVMGLLFMGSVLGFQGGIMGILRKKFKME
jgi:branched-chain amino acid transport system permease protein